MNSNFNKWILKLEFQLRVLFNGILEKEKLSENQLHNGAGSILYSENQKQLMAKIEIYLESLPLQQKLFE